MEIDKMLTVSTAHIDERSADYLDEQLNNLTVYDKNRYGWFIFCGEPYDVTEVPEPLNKVLLLAIENGCAWLCLDRDADTVEGLETYNW